MSTVLPKSLRKGDAVRNYEQVGPVTRVYKAKPWAIVAETESGQDLEFGPFERVELVNR